MARNILILGASYGSLLATKLLMAGHNVTLVCRKKTADLINREGSISDCPEKSCTKCARTETLFQEAIRNKSCFFFVVAVSYILFSSSTFSDAA